jgi:hypothetical protein
MIRNGYPLMRRFFRLKDNVAARLVYPPIMPVAAKDHGETLPRDVAWKFHATDKTSSLTR